MTIGPQAGFEMCGFRVKGTAITCAARTTLTNTSPLLRRNKVAMPRYCAGLNTADNIGQRERLRFLGYPSDEPIFSRQPTLDQTPVHCSSKARCSPVPAKRTAGAVQS